MKRSYTIHAFMILTLSVFSLALLADRGAGRKSKVRTTLTIAANKNSLKESVFCNLHNGVFYKGSYSTTHKTSTNILINSSLTTYQKGNTTFIIPFRSKVAVADFQPGFSGVKFTIRSSK